MTALIVSVWAAIVTHWQLRISRNTSGGRGVMFGVNRRSQFRGNDGTTTNTYRVWVELVGPGVRHQVAVVLQRDGRLLERFEDDAWTETPDTRKSMSCDDDPIDFEFQVDAQAADGVWCLLTWVDPRGSEIWTGAYARQLTSPDKIYEWHWYRSKRFRRWFQHRIRRGQTRTLGVWRIHKGLGIEDGQAPINLGRPPAPLPCARPALPRRT
jgi:hypothetical protein